MRLLRSLRLGIGLTALALGAGLSAPALSAAATIRGQFMDPGFGRISLSFDDATPVRLRASNGVLIIAFGQPVRLDADKLARELPEHIGMARLDPDGRGLRLALTRPFRTNLIEVGDRAYVDLLPEGWNGLPPGPPPEALAELGERLRRAELRAREAARLPVAPPQPLTLRSASLPTLDRLIFKAPEGTGLAHAATGDRLALTFDRPLAADAAAVRTVLPEGVKLASARTEGATTVLDLTVPPDRTVRVFQDEAGLIVDLARPAKSASAIERLVDATAKQADAPPATAPSPAPIVHAAGVEPAPVPAQAAPPRPSPAPAAPQPVAIEAVAEARGGRIDFRFPRPTGAAAYAEAGTVTLAFDSRDVIDPARLRGVLPETVEDIAVSRENRLILIRLRLRNEQLTRLWSDADQWSLGFGEAMGPPARPLEPQRLLDERGRGTVSLPVAGLTGIHWLSGRDGGPPLVVATALGPTLAVTKPYRFVEFGLPATAHGAVIAALADDLSVHAGQDEAVIGREPGLTLTLASAAPSERAPQQRGPAPTALVEPAEWRALREGDVRGRQLQLLVEAAQADLAAKSSARLNLARFLVANDLAPEAAGPLEAMLADDAAMRGHREALFLKAAISLQLHRNEQALRELQAGPLKDDAEAGLWRAFALQRLGREAEALAGFRRGEAFLDAYPDSLQAKLRPAMARTALALRDVPIAEAQIAHLPLLRQAPVPAEEIALLRAMLDEAAGRPKEALAAYRGLYDHRSRPVSAEAQLRGVRLARAAAQAPKPNEEAIARLETVAATWRGGRVEIEALDELGRIYVEEKRWRDAFLTARRANEDFPDHPITRRMHDETARRFEAIFTDGDADAGSISRFDALALFYDFKEFLPIGRRGDEIILRLADRLVEVDLLDQAGEILKHQMERRLGGAARSTVAARLAMIRLMGGKPAEALQALHTTRMAELPADVRRARLLLEAKALSDLSRTDQALELLEAEAGPEIDRLRADVFWTGRRWREAGEAYERLLGESWRGTAPLADSERGDTLRAAISYVMAEEPLSLDRLRTKYAAKMAEGSDARSFAFVTGANRADGRDIRDIARSAANADSLLDFMAAYRKRYPAYASSLRNGARPAEAATPPAQPASAAPEASAARQG